MNRPIDNCVKNVSRKLGAINMFYVKAFQSISSNSQLLSSSQIEFLSAYTDKVPFGAEDIDLNFRSAIAEVNRNKKDKLIIANFAIPIKSGMIALIYKGLLGNKQVIIKVARKNIRLRLSNALRQIDLLAQFLAFILQLQALNIEDIISENKDMMMLQTDFNNEVKNIITMRKKYRNIDSIEIPCVYQEYTDVYENIIVMDYLDGVTVMQIADEDRDIYAKELAQFSLKGVLFDRIIHADLHPGNVIFMKDANGNCTLGIIDYGVMLIITKQQQKDFFDFAYAFIIGKDSTKAFDIIVKAFIEPLVKDSYTNDRGKQKNNIQENSLQENNVQEDNLREKTFIKDIANVIESSLRHNSTIQSSDIYHINKILYGHGYRLTKEFCKIEMALAISDSICKQLNGENSYIDNITETATKILMPDIYSFK